MLVLLLLLVNIQCRQIKSKKSDILGQFLLVGCNVSDCVRHFKGRIINTAFTRMGTLPLTTKDIKTLR